METIHTAPVTLDESTHAYLLIKLRPRGKVILTDILFALMGIIIFATMTNPALAQTHPLRIALSWGSDNYVQYVQRAAPDAEIVNLKEMPLDEALRQLAGCQGIVFTGGEDVDPSRYGRPDAQSVCKTNPQRDSLEFALMQKAFQLKMPIMGICRGMQALNVFLGGSLVADIPSEKPGSIIHRDEDYLRCYHDVRLKPGSKLYRICQTPSGSVTSNHHQAVNKLAPGLKITATAMDGIPEAMEWENPDDKPFLLAVQWHPERMDTTSALSMPLIKAFLSACMPAR